MKTGTDRWGAYYDMTGYESEGFCFWCGKTAKNRRYCNKECQIEYQIHFIWKYARKWCITRADYKCEKCRTEQDCSSDYDGWEGDFGTRLEAHHIDPLNGDTRHINKKNRPENLICLCNKCHNETRKKPKVVEIKNLNQLYLF